MAIHTLVIEEELHRGKAAPSKTTWCYPFSSIFDTCVTQITFQCSLASEGELIKGERVRSIEKAD